LKLPTKRQIRKPFAILALFILGCQPLAAFDTFWHSATTGAATREFHFSDDATNIVQFGNFSGPDFFGPLYDEMVSKFTGRETPAQLKQLQDYETSQRNSNIRKAAIFLHFDNLSGKLNSNWRFNNLFMMLLKNTQSAINGFYGSQGLNEGSKKIAILMTLGASLHMVQDFYSHSDWVHQDFQKNFGLAPSKTPWGKLRAPTWFEVTHKAPYPWTWPITISSGIYPPPVTAPKSSLGIPMTHTNFNHDNSQLFYAGESQVRYHNFGPVPASQSPQEHQLYAANTAAMASIEWVRKLEEDPITKSAIDSAKDWKLEDYNPAMLKDLSSSLAVTLFLSCAVAKWDGAHPPAARASECKGVGIIATGEAGAGANAVPLLLPALSVMAFSFLNEFWAIHEHYDLLQLLVHGFGNLASGQYMFAADPTMQ
jgi:hypothetical protein